MTTKQNNTVIQLLSESFLQHTIVVSFTVLPGSQKVEFLPDSVKEEILNQLSDSDSGDFLVDETGGYEGLWCINKIHYNNSTLSDIIDQQTCALQNLRDQIEETGKNDKITTEAYSIIDDTLHSLDEALAEFHKLTDPDENITIEEDD